jgi:hypothetical protein
VQVTESENQLGGVEFCSFLLELAAHPEMLEQFTALYWIME